MPKFQTLSAIDALNKAMDFIQDYNESIIDAHTVHHDRKTLDPEIEADVRENERIIDSLEMLKSEISRFKPEGK